MINKLTAMLFPKKCPCCGSVIDMHSNFCDKCEKSFKRNNYIRTVKVDFENNLYPISFKCCSPFVYSGIIKIAIFKFKFRDKPKYCIPLADEQYKIIMQNFGDIKFDFISAVPQSHQKRKERGYNQAELLAKEISKHLNIPYLELLKVARKMDTQHTLSKEKRIKNVKNGFICLNSKKIEGKTILLCDDIITTGATLSECILALYKENPLNVYCTTIATTEIRNESNIT